MIERFRFEPSLSPIYFLPFPPAAAQTPHDIVDLGLNVKTVHNRHNSRVQFLCVALYCVLIPFSFYPDPLSNMAACIFCKIIKGTYT